MPSARDRRLSRPATLRLVLPAAAATLVTGGVVAGAVAASSSSGADDAAGADGAAAAAPLTLEAQDQPGYLADRSRAVSRSASRSNSQRTTARRVTMAALPKVTDRKFRTGNLNLWKAPTERGKPLAVLPEGGKVAVTGVRRNGFAQIVRSGQVRWVNSDYLADKRPAGSLAGASAATGGAVVSDAPCASGSSMESGIVGQAVTLHRSVCARFPQVSTYGGYRGDGEHVDGHAIDIMVSDSGTGQAIADWVRANAGTLHVDNVIWAQQIWTTQRSGEGWRGMPDRGSPTANHFDHVHVRVF